MIIATIMNAFPLSFSQCNILSLEKRFPGTSVNVISATMRIRGRLDIGLVQRALALVAENDPVLRTRVTLSGGRPSQYIVPPDGEPAPVFDFTQSGAESLAHWEQAMTRQASPVYDAPLWRPMIFKCGEADGGVLLIAHHLVSDGWSQLQLAGRIARVYLDLLAGRTPDLEPQPSYDCHVRSERTYLDSRTYNKDKTYWGERFDRPTEAAALRTDRGANLSPVGQRESYALSRRLCHAIGTFCAEERVAPFACLYLALAVYLRRVTGARRFTVGVPVLGRTTYEEQRGTGMYVSTLPFVGEPDETMTTREANRALAEDWYDLLRHQRFPFGALRDEARRHDPSLSELFHIVLSYQNGRIVAGPDATVSFSGRWHYSGSQAEHLCIHLSHWEDARRFTLDYDYLTQLFTSEEIARLHASLVHILTGMLDAPDRPLAALSVCDDEEAERVVYACNATDRPVFTASLARALEAAFAAHPARAAVISGGERLTYARLAARAREYAADIRAHLPEGVAAPVAAIRLPRDGRLFPAMCGAILSGCAFVLLPASQPEKRAEHILGDCGASVLIDAEGVHTLANEPKLEAPAAYIVYTSGSTGAPKGVAVGEAAFLNFAAAMQSVYGHGAVLSVCSVGFDAFLLESLAALLAERTIVLASESECESPEALAGLMRGYGVGFVSMPPSRLTALLRSTAFAESARGLEAVLCGGEAFPPALLETLELGTNARVYNQYGPSECTVGVTCHRIDGGAGLGIGTPLQNCRLYILDEHRHPLPAGVCGELYIGGVCVADGYVGAPALTAERFLQSPFEPGERVYRTGDAASREADGSLTLAGRRDDQCKLRGLRIEPGEIAAALEAHPAVEAAAVRVLGGDAPYLVGYYVAASAPDELALRAHLASLLPDYMVPPFLMRVPALPLSSSGKTDFSALPVPETDARTGAPLGETGERVLAAFRAQLGPDVGPDSDYFAAGGDSLRAMETLADIESACGVRLRVADLYVCRTARLLARRIAPGETASALPAAPRRDSYPLSPAQQSVYVCAALDPTGLMYNMPGALRFTGLTPERLEAAFRSVIADDALLRTAFVREGGDVVMKIADSVGFALERIDAPSFDAAARAFTRPFNLAAPPLLRAAVWQDCLFVDTHHLVSDGISTPVLLARLDAAYRGAETEPACPYIDYAWRMNHRDPAETAADADYWRGVLASPPPPLELPTDAPHPGTTAGASCVHPLPDALRTRVDAVCAERGLTPFMLLSAAFGLLMARVSGRGDLLVGTPVSGRTLPELWKMVGPMLGTLPLRFTFADGCTVGTYLDSVRDRVVGLLDHQETPLETLVDLTGTRGRGLYDVMFALRPLDADAFTLGGERLEYVSISTNTAKLELTCEAEWTPTRAALHLEYAPSLFAEATAALWARSFETLLGGLCGDAAAALDTLDATHPRDRLLLLEKPNRRRTPFDDAPLDVLLDDAALLAPDAPAVRFRGETTSFAALARRAAAVAGGLQARGISRGDRVAVCMARSPELLAVLWGIAKAGGVYVPMLAEYPEARRSYMLENAEAKLLVTDADWAGCPVPAAAPAALDAPFAAVAGRSTADLLYILYTSGSTGKPKGVMLPHRALANLLVSIAALFDGVPGTSLCATSVVFDTFITESLLALALGRTVALCDEEEAHLPHRLAAVVESENAGAAQFTPSRLTMCLASDAFRRALRRLSLVYLVGENLPFALQERFFALTDAALVNVYGPTEAAVYVTRGDMARGKPVTIGVPLYNCRIYVLDAARRPVMPTARGELWLAGECLADGYAQRPDLTEAVFVPDPFCGGRMYRSGDIGRLRADGSFECLGRADGQVKINGQRVELDEITGALPATGLVDEAAVIAMDDGAGSKRLRAFVVCGAMPDRHALAAALRHVLPAHMIPAEYIRLPALPRLASGKTDLGALRAWRGDTPAVADTPVVANTPAVANTPVVATTPPVANTPVVASTPPVANTPVVASTPAVASTPPAGEQRGTTETDSYINTENVTETKADVPDKGTPVPEKAPPTLTALTELWAAALGHTPEPDVSFFEQGGSSLRALGLLAEYDNRGWTLSLQDFYDANTLADQARLLIPDVPASEPPVTAQPVPAPPVPAPPVFESLASASPTAAPIPARVPEIATPDGVPCETLLTGATGFLGAHLLRALIEAGTPFVHCLTRGDSGRLRESLTWYFGTGWVEVNAARFAAVAGDVAAERLGLAPADFDRLAAHVGAVVHAAADVRHFGRREDADAVNVSGVRNVLAFCRAAGASLHHVSTLSVAGERLTADPERSAVFTECDLDIGQNWRDNVYVRSKLLGEAEIYAGGVPARVYRVGRLVGRESDGLFQRRAAGNSFYELIRGLRSLRAIPARLAGLSVDLTPVDTCARAIVALMSAPMPVCHLYNPHAPAFEKLAVSLLGSVELLDDDAFDIRLAGGGAEAELPYLRELWRSFRRYGVAIHPNADATLVRLALAGFVWRPPDVPLVLGGFR